MVLIGRSPIKNEIYNVKIILHNLRQCKCLKILHEIGDFTVETNINCLCDRTLENKTTLMRIEKKKGTKPDR